MKPSTLVVKGIEIRLFQEKAENFISLTDIAKQGGDEPRFIIQNWMRNTNTVRYLYEWEHLHNPDVNRVQLHTVLERSTNNRFTMTPKKWVELVKASGMYTKAGRGGGTYAHQDIALNFCYWLSPTFQIYLIKEFQRLKEEEASRIESNWDLKRTLSKINYAVHTDAIREELIPPRMTKGQGFIYAGEADLLNVAVFGETSKMWRSKHPKLKGNIRDHATPEQLLVLSNLEAVNAELIRMKLSQEERVDILNQAAIKQMTSLLFSPTIKTLPFSEDS